MSTHPSPPLLQVAGLTQELTVGLGTIAASVRTLTDVSLSVHAGELIVLSGPRGAGDHALLSVIAGDRRGVTGACDIRAHARVRLLRISTAAARALAEEWPRAASVIDGMTPPDRSALANAAQQPPEIFLLDVVPDADTGRTTSETPHTSPAATTCTPRSAPRCTARRSASSTSAPPPKPWDESNRHALLAWATLCRLRGGAVIMAAGHTLGDTILTHALTRQPARSVPVPVIAPVAAFASPRRTPATRAAAVHERRSEPTVVRVVVMHAGRVAPAIPLYARDLESAPADALTLNT